MCPQRPRSSQTGPRHAADAHDEPPPPPTPPPPPLTKGEAEQRWYQPLQPLPLEEPVVEHAVEVVCEGRHAEIVVDQPGGTKSRRRGRGVRGRPARTPQTTAGASQPRSENPHLTWTSAVKQPFRRTSPTSSEMSSLLYWNPHTPTHTHGSALSAPLWDVTQRCDQMWVKSPGWPERVRTGFLHQFMVESNRKSDATLLAGSGCANRPTPQPEPSDRRVTLAGDGHATGMMFACFIHMFQTEAPPPPPPP